MFTTLEEIKSFSPCTSGWKKLLRSLNISNPSETDLQMKITIKHIIKSNGVKDAYWCLRTQKYEDICLILADIVESILPNYTKRYPNDSRIADYIQGIRDFKKGVIDREKLKLLHVNVYVGLTFTSAYADDAAAFVGIAYTSACTAYASAFITACKAADAANAADAAASAAGATIFVANVAKKRQWNLNEKILRKYL